MRIYLSGRSGQAFGGFRLPYRCGRLWGARKGDNRSRCGETSVGGGGDGCWCPVYSCCRSVGVLG